MSGGVYTQDFDVLAKDAVLAMKEARRLAGECGECVYQGAAPADFNLVSFGQAVTILESIKEKKKTGSNQ